MKFIDFVKKQNSEMNSLGFLLQGDDSYFKDRAYEKILSFSNITNEELNFSKFDGEHFDDFLMSLNSYPFLSEKRLSVITMDKIEAKHVTSLKEYVKNLNPTSIFVIVNNGDKIAEIKEILTVECIRESEQVVKAWIRKKFKMSGFAIDEKAISMISERALRDMGRVSLFSDMLISYAKGKNEITVEDVELLVPFEMEAESFDLVNAIVDKNISKALSLYEKFKAQKLPDTLVISSLYASFRRMFLAVTSGQTNAEVAEKLSVKEYAIKKSKETAKKYSKMKLKKALDILFEAENGIKSGKLCSDEILLTTILLLLEN